MLEFVIFAITIVVFLVFALSYLMQGGRRMTTIPGPQPVDSLEGNIPDIISSGSLNKFLQDLHQTYGPIASFWWGPKLAVSIASPQLFKEHSKPFDRPAEFFEQLLPLIGGDSLQTTNGQTGRKRHAAYAKCFNSEAMYKYFDLFTTLTGEFIDKWDSLPADDHIPLRQTIYALTIKAMLQAAMGNFFNDDAKIHRIRQAYDVVWTELEERLQSGASDTSSMKQQHFDQQIKVMHETMLECMAYRRQNPPTAAEYLLIDAALELDMSEATTLSDLITVFVGGFHTTALLIIWALHYIASHRDVQDRLHQEVDGVIGTGIIDMNNINQLPYMQQVLNETVRCCTLVNFAARVQDIEIELGGHKIPAGTPIMQALFVLHQDKTLYPEPDKFDPERFSPENVASRPSFSFEPFGFAGKRKCLGYRFALVEAKIVLSEILRKFQVSMIEGQVITPVYGLMTLPNDEIWVSISERNI